MKKDTLYFFVWACITTAVCGLIYAAVQQDIRSGANDPQIQISEDVSGVLAQGAPATSILSGQSIDMSTSLATYAIIFNDVGKPIASSVTLHGTQPVPPPGVFEYARTHTTDNFTWQPEMGVRSAAVLRHFSATGAGSASGFILVGRSMREIEAREDNILHMLMIGWITSLAFIFLSFVCIRVWFSRHSTHQ